MFVSFSETDIDQINIKHTLYVLVLIKKSSTCDLLDC